MQGLRRPRRRAYIGRLRRPYIGVLIGPTQDLRRVTTQDLHRPYIDGSSYRCAAYVTPTRNSYQLMQGLRRHYIGGSAYRFDAYVTPTCSLLLKVCTVMTRYFNQQNTIYLGAYHNNFILQQHQCPSSFAIRVNECQWHKLLNKQILNARFTTEVNKEKHLKEQKTVLKYNCQCLKRQDCLHFTPQQVSAITLQAKPFTKGNVAIQLYYVVTFRGKFSCLNEEQTVQ